MKENDQGKRERIKSFSNYQRDGTKEDEDISRTILPNEFQVIEEQKKYVKSKEKIFVGNDSLDDLSGRIISAISNPIRLKIILILDEEPRKPITDQEIMDEKGIYRILKSRYNIKVGGLAQNHIKPLQDAGLIRRTSGVRNNEPVYIYEIVPGAMESLITLLSNISSTVRTAINKGSHLNNLYPMIKVLGGPQDQVTFELKKNITLIGRKGTLGNNDLINFVDDIILDNEYRSVTRISNNSKFKTSHAKIFNEENNWYIEDSGKNHCGTFINEKKVKIQKLRDYDVIGLSRGKYSVDLLFRKNNYNNPSLNSNPWTDLDKYSPEQQQLLASKIQIILNKVTFDFFLDTLENIVINIRQLQEIQILTMDEKVQELSNHHSSDKKLAEKIIKSLNDEKDPEFKDRLVNHYYNKLKEQKEIK